MCQKKMVKLFLFKDTVEKHIHMGKIFYFKKHKILRSEIFSKCEQNYTCDCYESYKADHEHLNYIFTA